MDAVQRVVIVSCGSAAEQQIQLQEIERIDIGKAELNGFAKSGMVLQQFGLAGQLEHDIARDVPFRGNPVENAVRQFLIFDKIGVTARNLQVRFGQDHLEIGDDGPEKL